MDCQLVEIGGVEDHIHVLVRINSTTTIANLAKRMKGASSHLVTHCLSANPDFKWQESYAAFSVDYCHHEELIFYIQNQQKHHAAGDCRSDWEFMDDD
jgi:REP element-mobilizing transposase RayT